jgi:hypothetical protein
VSRPRDQPPTLEKNALLDAQKSNELEEPYKQVPGSRYKALALTDLEASVMWIIEELAA